MIRSLSPNDPTRVSVVALFAILVYQGYAMATNGIAAPFIAASFGLDDAGIARLYAFIAPAALGTLALLRISDRVGRRSVLLACMFATPLAALATGLSETVPGFVVFAVLLYSCTGACALVAMILLAESLPEERRGRGLSYAGMATAVGAGGALILMPVLDTVGLSWRWLFLISGLGLLWVPLLPLAIRESHSWNLASTSGAGAKSRLLDVFDSRYRSRFIPLSLSLFLSIMGSATADAWSYYHAVHTAGLTSVTASVMVLTSGGLSLVGFHVGARACDRFGRVPTVVVSWLMVSAASLCYYWGSPVEHSHTVYWLGASFFWMKAAGNASIVGIRLVIMEMYPAALRGTMIGWAALVATLSMMIGQVIIVLLAIPPGDVARAVAYLALLGLPAAYLFGRHFNERLL